MAKLVTCKACGHAVSKKAKSCPNCGEPMKGGSSTLSGCLILLILFSGSFVCFIVMPDSSSDYSSSPSASQQNSDGRGSTEPPLNDWSNRDAKVEAYLICEDAIKTQLRAPSTAEFQSIFAGRFDNVVQANQRYYFESYVDAQNGFGAMIRTNFECSVTQTEEGLWTINRADIIE